MNHNILHYKNRQTARDNYKLNKEKNVIDNNQEKISRFSSFLRECLRVSKKKVLIVLPNISYYESRFRFLLKGHLGSKYHFSGDNKDDRHKWFTNFYLVKNFFEKNSVNFEIKKVIKQRNKLKPLVYLENYLAKFFPNIFSWSFLITINKN